MLGHPFQIKVLPSSAKGTQGGSSRRISSDKTRKSSVSSEEEEEEELSDRGN